MRHVTLTLALVITLIISVPATAQDTFTVEKDGVFSLVLDHLREVFYSLFDKDAAGDTTDDNQSSPEEDPVDPPSNEFGPMLEPSG